MKGTNMTNAGVRCAALVLFLLGFAAGLAAGCRDSGQPLTPTSVPLSDRLLALTVTGRTSLTAIGETSQLTAIATASDGTKREVVADVSWNSLNSAVVTISSSGLATAVGFGGARIDVSHRSVSTTVQILVTPAGTFVVTGNVREPGQGGLAGVHVLEPVSGSATLTDQSGNYMLAALASTHLLFEKAGYEPGALEIPANRTADMRMPRMVRIMVGETAVVPKLAHMDMSYDVGADRCYPCRLIRIIAPTVGAVHLELAWQPRNPGSPLHLWAGGHRVAGDATEGRLALDAAVTAGENVVYVGYYRPSMFNGSSIEFTLATSMSP